MSRRWVVDGCNVVGARPDGWWRDRAGANARMVTALTAFAAAAEGDGQVTVVFDGRGPARASPADERSPVRVVHTPSADDRIVELVHGDGDPSTLTVVTSDRDLARRVASAGAAVMGAGSFRSRLEGWPNVKPGTNGPVTTSQPKVHDRGDDMGDTGPESGAKGAVEGIKGKAKEAAGVVSGDDELEREGEAQQEKADAQRDVAAKEAEAEKARAEAAGHEAEQRANQQ